MNTEERRIIYLDHNATTPTRPEVIEAMAECLRRGEGNPASQHRAGSRARRILEDAREAIAAMLGADATASPPDRVIFTSGGTEANNLAVLGISQARAALGPPPRPGHANQIIISGIEHSSVLEPAESLLEEGWRLDTLGATPEGIVRLDRLEGLLGPETRLVSVILGNHETGVLQPVDEVARICRSHGIPVHTDAVQVVGKIPVDFRRLGVAAMSLAAHKFQGPPGIGALICAPEVPLRPLLFGGPQQWGLRPGTEPVALVVGMKVALEFWQKEATTEIERLTRLRTRFEEGLKAALPEIIIHGQTAPRLPQTSNIAFPGLEAQMLLLALDVAGVACSIGAACASGSAEPSPTLRAMGLPKELVRSSLRFSLGATTTEEDIDEAIKRIVSAVQRLKKHGTAPAR
jgi:cysteine desulfurase